MYRLILKDFKMLLHYRQFIIISIIFPLLILGLLGFAFTDFIEKKSIVDRIDVGLINHDDSQASELLIKDFQNNEAFTKLFNLEGYKPDEAQEKYDSEGINAIIEIPEGFSESLLYYRNTPIQLTVNPNMPFKSLILKHIMDSYSTYVTTADIAVYTLYQQIKSADIPSRDVSKINDAFSVEMIFTALGRDKMFQYRPITTIPSSSSMEYFVIATGVLLVMYMGLIGANMVIYERDTMCLSRYRASSGPIWKFVFSKIIVLFLVTMLQVILLLFPIGFVLSFDVSFSLLNIIFFLSISLLSIISFSILLGSLIHTEEVATLIGNIGILLMGLIGGSFFPLKLMPSFMEGIAQVTPNYWIIKGFLFLFKGFELKDVQMSIVVLTSSVVLFTLLSMVKLKQSG